MAWELSTLAALVVIALVLRLRYGPPSGWIGSLAGRVGLTENQVMGAFFLTTLVVWAIMWFTLHDEFGDNLDAAMDEFYKEGGELLGNP